MTYGKPDPTEIRINEYGDEEHESWLLIRANHITATQGLRLFDSEIRHNHAIVVYVSRSRKRDLSRDWLHARVTPLLEINMSQAQWGAFVSSFGNGSGVPATLRYLEGVGQVPQAANEVSRLEKSHEEVLRSGEEGMEKIKECYAKVMEAFENGGRRDQREALRLLGSMITNAPKNMEYAAKSLTEHAENVVTKARGDIEAMALEAQRILGESIVPALEAGEEPLTPYEVEQRARVEARRGKTLYGEES